LPQSDPGDLNLEALQVVGSALRGGVPSVQQAVDENLVHPLAPGHFDQGIQMRLMGMHAAVGQETGQMQPAASRLGLLHALHQHLVLEKIPVLDRLGDTGQILIHHAPGTYVGVPHLGVPHLSGGKAHREPGAVDLAMGIGGAKPRHVGRFRLGDGVGVAVGAYSPAVQDHQEQRFLWHVGLPRLAK